MTAQEAPGNQAANDPLKLSIQLLMQHSEAFFNALEQSEKWLNIEPELMAAMTTIEARGIVSTVEVCRNLEDRISEEDLFNLCGLLKSRMATESLAHIRKEMPEDPLKIGSMVYWAMAAAAAHQRLRGAVPVKKALEEWEPYVERDEVRQGGCSTGGKNSGESRAEEAKDRYKKVITAAKEMLAAGQSYSLVIRILAKRPFKSDGVPYSKRHIERILAKAGIVPPGTKTAT